MLEDPRRRHRARQIVEVVEGLLRAAILFRRIEDLYRRDRLHFEDLRRFVDDRGESVLFNLKEQCHNLFRRKGLYQVSEKEEFFDLAVGSIFHEGMKVREDLYQLQVYRPRFLALEHKEAQNQEPLSPTERDYLRQFKNILERANRGLREGLKEIRLLLADSLQQLRDLLRDHAPNDLLSRFLLEHEALVARVYGNGGLRMLLAGMFEGGLFEACRLAGRSYSESSYYTLAAKAYRRALTLRPSDKETRLLYILHRGLGHFYASHYTGALSAFRQALRIVGSAPLPPLFARVRECCLLMLRERRGERIAQGAQR
ncbi:MAG: hypothetical protein HYY85_17690, partial [Deltaproteobacteria bacterium]|nr:hypothetical protein [Deltaproteobacteria bacterium]